ncbi:MAG: hypothetical protein FWC90_06290 [Oscillospiraceae bacterium]|nr:hypothetical protein [Oscillospiraceae bacterium]
MKRTIAMILLLVTVIGLVGLAGCASTYRVRSTAPVRDGVQQDGRQVPYPRPHAGTHPRRQPRANAPADNESTKDRERGNLPQTGVGGAHDGNRAGTHAGNRAGMAMPNLPGIAHHTGAPLKPPTPPQQNAPTKPAEAKRGNAPTPPPAPAPSENAPSRNKPAA